MQLNELKRDPSRPLNDVRIISTHEHRRASEFQAQLQQEEAQKKNRWRFFYDKEKKTFCGRSCTSWVHIVAYSIFYIIFLCTYSMILLYISLAFIKSGHAYNYPEYLILRSNSRLGLTATPTAVNKISLIAYRDGESGDYGKYVTALEKLISKRHSDVIDRLGPCRAAPFGYGNAPCVIIRINKHYASTGLPLTPKTNSSNIPPKVQLLASTGSKLWLQCSGNSPYDEEHIGKIKYYPDPPGFDPGVYAPGKDCNISLVAVQFSNFTKGLALAVQCSVYYEGGKSTVDFVLYVSSSRQLT